MKRGQSASQQIDQDQPPAWLHPEQQAAWTRIHRHLKRTDGAFRWRDIQRLYYRQSGRCFYCRQPFPGGDRPSTAWFHIDHRKPVVKGGRNDPHNLALACRRCNLEKSGANFHVYLRARRRRGLPAPTRDQEFPLFDLPEQIAQEREARKAQRERAREAGIKAILRKHPAKTRKGTAGNGEEPIGRPDPRVERRRRLRRYTEPKRSSSRVSKRSRGEHLDFSGVAKAERTSR